VATVEQAIEVEVPVTTAYNQWTQFEMFPQFMEGVVDVRQLDDTHLHWVAEVGGERREWDAEIVRQEPDRAIEWRSLDGRQPSGEVLFEPVNGGNRTRVTVHMEYEAQGMKESLGSTLGLDDRRVKQDLERFKELIESRGIETGAWRGEVRGGEVRQGTMSPTAGMGTDPMRPAGGAGSERPDELGERPTNPY